MASSDTPELEEILFYQYLTTNFPDLYAKVQEICSIIIVPQHITNPSIITRDLVESHLFQPSLFFIQKHISLNEKYEIEFDSNRTIRVVEKKDNSNEKRIKILGQEDVRDSIRQRSYNILIVEQVIVDITKFKQNSNVSVSKLQNTRPPVFVSCSFKSLIDICRLFSKDPLFNATTASYETSFMFLDSLRQIEPPFAQLRTQLFLFNEKYVNLPKYVENALEKLREQRTHFLQQAYQLLNKTNEDRDIELASEIFITGNIYTKVWPIVLQFSEDKDENLYNQIRKRNRKQLSKLIAVNSSKNITALNELKKLDDLKSAYEKAKCIRSALDLTISAISMMTVDPQNSSVSYHATNNAAPMAADETITAFIDVICQLVAQSDSKDAINLYAHAYYIEKFRFLPLPQDYAFTTYQGVLEYLSTNASTFS